MATLTIRKLSDEVKDKLRLRAAQHGRSMEAEARDLLAAAVSEPEPKTEPEPKAAAERRGSASDGGAEAAPHTVEVASLIDELIAERRIEAWQETLDALRAHRQAAAMARQDEDK